MGGGRLLASKRSCRSAYSSRLRFGSAGCCKCFLKFLPELYCNRFIGRHEGIVSETRELGSLREKQNGKGRKAADHRRGTLACRRVVREQCWLVRGADEAQPYQARNGEGHQW